jgi:hypothetical protein
VATLRRSAVTATLARWRWDEVFVKVNGAARIALYPCGLGRPDLIGFRDTRTEAAERQWLGRQSLAENQNSG